MSDTELPKLDLGIEPTESAPVTNGTPNLALQPQEEEKAIADSLSLENLSPEEQKIVGDFVQKIDLNNTDIVTQYGAGAQTKIAQFSDSVLQNIKTKDLGEAGKSLSNLVVEIKSFDASTEEKTGFFGFLSKGNSVAKQIEKLMSGYSKVEVNIDKIVSSLEGHQRTLLKDMAVMDEMYKKNHEYFKELSLYIVAGNERLKTFKEVDIPKQEELARTKGDEMEIQKVNDMKNTVNRFEKKLHDLKISRTISIQMAPQIRLIQNNDAQLVEKIQSSLVNSIPLWKNQMVIALGLANSKAALEAQSKVTDMTNELLVKNSEMLKQGSIDIAKESERSIVSIETVRKTNENLITTITEVLAIQEQGSAQRAAAEVELTKIEGELKQALLQSKN